MASPAPAKGNSKGYRALPEIAQELGEDEKAIRDFAAQCGAEIVDRPIGGVPIAHLSEKDYRDIKKLHEY